MDFEIKHDLLSIESVIIDFSKEYDDCWVNFSPNFYGIKIIRNDDEQINIWISENKDNNSIELLLHNIKDGYIITPRLIENINFESLGIRLRDIYRETIHKWDDEDEKEYQRYLEIKDRKSKEKDENNNL